MVDSKTMVLTRVSAAVMLLAVLGVRATTLPVNLNLIVIVDDLMKSVYANGVQIDGKVGKTRLYSLDVGYFAIPASTSQISIYGQNIGGFCGLIATDYSGKFVTDNTWRCSTIWQQGWSDVSYNDSSWALASLVDAHQQSELLTRARMISIPNCQANQDFYCRSSRVLDYVNLNLIVIVDDLMKSVYADGVQINGKVGKTRQYSVDVGYFAIPASTSQISIYGQNTGGFCGLIATDYSGKFITDNTWRCSTIWQQGWSDLSYDDSAWAAATIVDAWWQHSELLTRARMISIPNCQANQDFYCRSSRV